LNISVLLTGLFVRELTSLISWFVVQAIHDAMRLSLFY